MSKYGPQIAALARRAERDRRYVSETQPDPPDHEAAMAYLREGAGPAVWTYVDGRTGGAYVHFSPAEFEALEKAMNRWLECYTACYGVEIDASFTLRQAAELLLETRNIRDVAQLLTGVPERSA